MMTQDQIILALIPAYNEYLVLTEDKQKTLCAKDMVETANIILKKIEEINQQTARNDQIPDHIDSNETVR